MYKVAILSSTGRSEALASELRGIAISGSNQKTEDLKRLVEAAVDTFGGVDAVVNSAGHGPKGPILELSDEDWHLGMEVYFLNVVRIARLVTPIILKTAMGRELHIEIIHN